MIQIDSEFKNLIPPLSSEERQGLESSLLKEGCHAALPYRAAHRAEDRTRMAGEQGFCEGVYEL